MTPPHAAPQAMVTVTVPPRPLLMLWYKSTSPLPLLPSPASFSFFPVWSSGRFNSTTARPSRSALPRLGLITSGSLVLFRRRCEAGGMQKSRRALMKRRAAAAAQEQSVGEAARRKRQLYGFSASLLVAPWVARLLNSLIGHVDGQHADYPPDSQVHLLGNLDRVTSTRTDTGLKW